LLVEGVFWTFCVEDLQSWVINPKKKEPTPIDGPGLPVPDGYAQYPTDTGREAHF
jgi:hypothetical protein